MKPRRSYNGATRVRRKHSWRCNETRPELQWSFVGRAGVVLELRRSCIEASLEPAVLHWSSSGAAMELRRRRRCCVGAPPGAAMELRRKRRRTGAALEHGGGAMEIQVWEGAVLVDMQQEEEDRLRAYGSTGSCALIERLLRG